MKTLLLAAILIFNPFHVVKRIASDAWYTAANFFVNHIQPNQKGEHGKVVPPAPRPAFDPHRHP
jgi:hypothetical protein